MDNICPGMYAMSWGLELMLQAMAGLRITTYSPRTNIYTLIDQHVWSTLRDEEFRFITFEQNEQIDTLLLIPHQDTPWGC